MQWLSRQEQNVLPMALRKALRQFAPAQTMPEKWLPMPHFAVMKFGPLSPPGHWPLKSLIDGA